MDFFKTWIMPPLVGAIIGYFTNWLAIKMLFRPLKPVYVGRFKLPFTPGILPRERLRLSDSVGETVSRELLTPEVFKTRLDEPALRIKIESAIYLIIDDFLEGEASSLAKALAGDGAVVKFTETEAGGIVAHSLEAVLRSSDFRAALAEAAGRAAAAAGKIPLGSILPAEKVREVAEHFAGEWGRTDRQDMMDAFLDRLFELPLGARPLVSPQSLSPLIETGTRSLYAKLLPVVEKILGSEAVKADLERAGRDIVKKAIGRLGPLQRLIVSAANYEKTLNEMMPDTIKDVSDAVTQLLRSQDMADKIVASVLSYAITPRIPHSSAPLAGLLPVPELKKSLGLFFKGLSLEKESFAESVEQRYRGIADKSLSELLPGLPEALAGGVASSVADQDLSEAAENRPQQQPIHRQPAVDLLSSSFKDFFLTYAQRIEGRTTGEILGLGSDEKRAISRIVAEATTKALSSQAGRLVEALDIRSMVVEKLNALDMADIERIILQVVKNELTWITVLGGILGAFIGVIQSLLSLL